MQSAEIREASGLAASRGNKGILWTHNDHGGSASIYAMTADGRHAGSFVLKRAKSRDWEDIAVGPGPEPNVSYIYIGDIGDNNARYKSIRVYRLPEPDVDVNKPATGAVLDSFDLIELTYPDGPRNAETLMIDPLTKDIYIVSKESATKLYRAPYPQETGSMTALEKVGTVPIGTAVGGDISPAGDMIIIRGYFAASLWTRDSGRTVIEAIKSRECKAPLILEMQGEAVCFAADGAGYYTVSEGRHQPIYYFARRQNE